MGRQGDEGGAGVLNNEGRKIVGPKVPIGVELDLHFHFTELMRSRAYIIIAYKEYPHTDGLERLHELYRLTMQQAAGQIAPVTAVFDCRMVGMWHTPTEPMKSFVSRMQIGRASCRERVCQYV